MFKFSVEYSNEQKIGDGDAPVEAVANFLKRIRSDQYATVEYKNWRQPALSDPKVWLPKELGYLKERFS